MAVQLMSHFFLHHKNLKKTKDGIWGMDDENNEINESLRLTSFVYVCLYVTGFEKSRLPRTIINI